MNNYLKVPTTWHKKQQPVLELRKTVLQLMLLIMLFAFAACEKIAETNQLEFKPTIRRQISNLNATMALPPLNEFKVMSFNVRHTETGDPETLDQRKVKIRDLILAKSPDLVGLQETSDPVITQWFTDQLAATYGVATTTSTVTPKLIFYKKTRFTLMSSGFSAMEPGTAQSMIWAVFKDIVTNNQYFVTNSHWSPAGSTNRMSDAKAIVAVIQAKNTSNFPLITFGDFNAQPGTAEIEYYKTSLDVIDALGDSLGDLTFHGWDAIGNTKIDWMMSNRKMGFLSWEVMDQPGPGGLWPSDHWAVMATYVPAVFAEPTEDSHGTSASPNTDFNFGDVNGDGKMDKIYWNYGADSGKPAVYLSNGDGTFTYAAKITGAASTLPGTIYCYGDVNGDGKDDVMVWEPTLATGHTRVFLATSAGNFSTTAIENPENGSTTSTTLYHLADVNGDGKADKIRWTASYDSGRTRINLATTAGSFNATAVVDTDGASTTAGTNFYYADVNNDNKCDKIMWQPTLNSGKTMVYLSDGNGLFTPSASFSNSGASGTATTTKFFFADINGDGSADKIYWNPANFLGKLKVYYSGAGNSFEGPIYSLRGTSQSTDTYFYFYDINGDGKADQIRWNYTLNSGYLSTYLSN
ncbi:FG-GAP-like repeat-containing protein [Pedobacter heparinus]|uniref:Endonuclease/exonuclease/phosphatase n=1 Tax=Pedobacter heparinus (strain ATCC 13125 / DSM 2366 / CIP 104194 / JCM 7457 / NBRC 12017 / NCIMB 9290 / NRRL B-14731 / HIM 762-3) TaxID=485917 RepID=C6XUV9_PEDHD|nr:FG-GAP-like repeat-containing protein [Pedobacter heparinus]ACU05967.1 Endonuclease/exonuclease/phosphatase [Pedobacter heparinus DSM 2366]